MPGHYEWDNNALRASMNDWVDYSYFKSVVKKLQGVPFHIVSERQAARDMIVNMPTAAPFSKDKRFPENKLYVNVSNGVMAERITRLLSALNFKDRRGEVKLQSEKSTGDAVEHESFRALQDASRAFSATVSSILTDLTSGDDVDFLYINGVWTRTSLEDQLALTWKTT